MNKISNKSSFTPTHSQELKRVDSKNSGKVNSKNSTDYFASSKKDLTPSSPRVITPNSTPLVNGPTIQSKNHQGKQLGKWVTLIEAQVRLIEKNCDALNKNLQTTKDNARASKNKGNSSDIKGIIQEAKALQKDIKKICEKSNQLQQSAHEAFNQFSHDDLSYTECETKLMRNYDKASHLISKTIDNSPQQASPNKKDLKSNVSLTGIEVNSSSISERQITIADPDFSDEEEEFKNTEINLESSIDDFPNKNHYETLIEGLLQKNESSTLRDLWNVLQNEENISDAEKYQTLIYAILQAKKA